MSTRARSPTAFGAGPLEAEILRSLRRITRAIDLHSRQLVEQHGLTAPQLLCLRILVQRGALKATELAREMTLSPATVTGIVDRLVARELVVRNRSDEDRRIVTLSITAAGRRTAGQVPSLLQDRFAQRLRALPVAEQGALRDALSRIVKMMDAEELVVAPVLATGPADVSARRVRAFLSDPVDDTPAARPPARRRAHAKG